MCHQTLWDQGEGLGDNGTTRQRDCVTTGPRDYAFSGSFIQYQGNFQRTDDSELLIQIIYFVMLSHCIALSRSHSPISQSSLRPLIALEVSFLEKATATKKRPLRLASRWITTFALSETYLSPSVTGQVWKRSRESWVANPTL